MSLVDEINKPVVLIRPIEGSGQGLPANCIFEVELTFKEIEGVVPYPPLKYISSSRPITSAENNPTDLLSSLADRISKHKIHHDFLKEKQDIVDGFLNQMWGV